MKCMPDGHTGHRAFFLVVARIAMFEH